MNKWFFSILMFFLVSSCSDDNQTFQGETRIGWDDFVSKNIEGRVLSFDEIIEKPYQLMIKDSILITLNSNADSICHVFLLRVPIDFVNLLSLETFACDSSLYDLLCKNHFGG